MPATAILLWVINLLLDTTGQIAFKTAAVNSAERGPGRYSGWAFCAMWPSFWCGPPSFH